MKKVLRKTLKVFAWIIGSVIFLLLLVIILIQVPAVQDFARKKTVAFLEEKLGTKVEIGKISLSIPKRLVLENIYFEDQHKDTLLAGKELRVDISMLRLLKNEVDIQYIELNGIRLNIHRTQPDTAFNFEYIVNAFVTEQTAETPPPDSTSNLKFNVDRIVLNNISASFKDDASGSDMRILLGDFETKINTFDPFNFTFDVPLISISNVSSSITQYKPLITLLQDTSVTADSGTTPVPDITLGKVNLENIQFDFKNEISEVFANLDIGEFIAQIKKINLNNNDLRINSIGLNNTTAKVLLGKKQNINKAVTEPENITDSSTADLVWNVLVDNINLRNNDIQFDDNASPAMSRGMDYSHLNVQDLLFQASNLTFTPTEYKGSVRQIAFKEKSGFDLRRFHVDFIYNDSTTQLNDLLVQTDKTLLRDKVILKYPSISALSNTPGELYIDAELDQCVIAMKDIITFAPQLATNLSRSTNQFLKINTSIEGYLKNLSIPFFQVNGLGNTAVNISGNIRGLPDAAKAVYNINIDQFKTTAKDINSLLPAGTIPSNIRIPNTINAKGYFKGSADQFNTQLQLNTSNGNAFVKGNMRSGESYVATVSLNNLNVGYLTKQEQNIGKVTMRANVKGRGYDLKTANASINGVIQSAVLKGYNYQNLELDASLENGLADLTANMNDPNIAFLLQASGNMKETYPTDVHVDLMLDTLNVGKLNLTTDTMGLQGKILADFATTNPDFLNGSLLVNDLVITTPTQYISTDSIYVNAIADTDSKRLYIESEMLKATLTGDYKLTELAAALQQTINKYYTLPDYTAQRVAPQQWNMDAVFYPSSPLVLQFVPGLQGSDSALITASFNSINPVNDTSDFQIEYRQNKLVFDQIQSDSINLVATTDAEKLHFALSVQQANASSIQLFNTTLQGNIADNKLDFALDIQDKENKTQYRIAAILNQIQDGLQISLKPDQLILDHEQWNVSQDNFIRYDSSGVIVNNLILSNGDQMLTVKSSDLDVHAPILVNFSNFEIATLTKIANQDSLLAGGVINGSATITDVMQTPVFTSDLTIENLSYNSDTLGNATIKVDNKQANAFAADINLFGRGNDVNVSGLYYTGEGKMDLKLNMDSLNLEIIKTFAAGQLNDIGGIARANIDIKGTIEDPSVLGELHFENAYIVPAISGERFTLSRESINFTNEGMVLNDLTLRDSAGNMAVISGKILTQDYLDYRFAVDVNAEDFRLVNVAKNTNQLFYGKLNIDADIELRGDMDSPTADAYLKVNEETDFYLVFPVTGDPEIIDRAGIVRFIDKDHPYLDSARQQTIFDSLTNQSEVKGIDVTANITTDTSARFTLIIDERNGDALTLKGRADLAGGIDKSGKVSLTGNYEIQDGSYEISLSLLKRQFQLQKGSTITWTGDPTSALVDITAIYNVRTAPIDLVGHQLTGRSPAEITRFKERLPFQVFLQMEGELLKPIITFDVSLPEDELSEWPDVDAKLQQIRSDPSELNKQVFALLLLNRFVQENPFESQAGGTTGEDILRQSASRILTDQLNQLAGSLITGVDLNFDLVSEKDYTTGTEQNRTDLNVGVSKQLLNDRLRVNVGSNFELEGTPRTGERGNVIAGDVSIDYQLSKDARYMVRAYRKNEYEQVVQGQVIETGVSFIITMDYNHFMELISGRQEKKQIKKEVKESIQEAKKEEIESNIIHENKD